VENGYRRVFGMHWPDIGVSLPITQCTIFIAFAIIGGGLKFIDEAFDEGIFNKKLAILLAPLLVVIWVWLSVADPISAIILFSILFSVLLSGKIDNFVFKISTLTLILFFVSTGSFGSVWMPLLILVAMGLLDEKGNDYVDENKTNKVVEFFFLHRFSMKLGVLALCTTSILPWLYLFAFLTFDIAYDYIDMVGQSLAVISTPKYNCFKVEHI
jgi:hypothetical protein